MEPQYDGRTSTPQLGAEDLVDAWPVLAPPERVEGFRLLPQPVAEEFFLNLDAREQADLIMALPPADRRLWMRSLAPDDAADLIQNRPPEERDALLALLDDTSRKEVSALLAYAEDDAGGLMSPHFARVRPDMTVDEAIRYLRKQAQERIETIYYAYVLAPDQTLLGVVTFRDLFSAAADKRVHDVMLKDVVSVPDDMDQEQVGRLFSQHRLMAMPVVDAQKRMKGIVTFDDIVDVVQEEATEDIQKMGGAEALDAPYMEVDFLTMLKKRAGWMAVLFMGGMLTATAIGGFSDEIDRAVVLALFMPLVISSGGNCGSQASTLVIRALALGEVKLRDWWRICRRELGMGVALGGFLGLLGFLRIVLVDVVTHAYGQHALLLAGAVAVSLVGVVVFGTLTGSMLPLVLRRAGFDPASASAPFVATLVDVTGLLIYFSAAKLILTGTLL